MDRNEFLGQADVAGFIKWLKDRLPTQKFHLNMKESRFAPKGLNVEVTGLPSVLNYYIWNTSWNDANGVRKTSSDWKTTSSSLQLLREWLGDAVSNNNEGDAWAAAREILRWGGVRGAIPFLNQLYAQKGLVAYLQKIKPLMALDGMPSQRLRDLNEHNVERFDAGLTKIHALIDDSGSPIYDSRVGAAIAMLYALYRQQEAATGPALAFPSGSALGNQIRNPGDLGLGFKSAPQFFTNAVPRHEWARWQVRLGWILRAVLEQCEWFTSDVENGDMAARCHAFEACLFMIGYDLRCFSAARVATTPEPVPAGLIPDHPQAAGWVPTGHSFKRVINLYANYRLQDGNDDAAGFQQWLVTTHNRTALGARAYCFPLRENEFGLFGCEKSRLDLIVKGGKEGLYAALGTDEPYASGDEKGNVCLVDVWIAGRVAHLTRDARNQALICAGFAGTQNAAATLLTVGRNAGHHFGLLDEGGQPTDFYDQFFNGGAGPDDLEQRIGKCFPKSDR